MFYGLDIGGTKIELAAFDHNFNLIEQVRKSTPLDDYPLFLATITEMVNGFDKKLSCKGSVGIGFPGIQDYQDDTFISVNIPCVIGKALDRDLSKLLDREVLVENDCKCFALSEAVLGSAKDYKNVFGAIIGTGAGGGQVSEGQLHSGVRGFAGEWGHITASAFLIDKYKLPLWPCACGLTGCAEQYVSGSGLQNIYRYLYQKSTNQSLEKVSGQQIMCLVEEKDETAQQAFAMYLDMLAASLATMHLSYDLDAIVLGGGMSNVKALYEKLPALIAQHLFARVPVPAIIAPQLGDSSGVRGAALLHKR